MTFTFTFELDVCRIRFAESGFEIRFSESVHSVREPESGLANPAKPVLTWIHWRSRTCLAVKWRLRRAYTNNNDVTSDNTNESRFQTVRFAGEYEFRFTMKLHLDSVKSNAALDNIRINQGAKYLGKRSQFRSYCPDTHTHTHTHTRTPDRLLHLDD